ncbi:hypothetical protein ACJX0J_025811, partial [Zea mays]
KKKIYPQIQGILIDQQRSLNVERKVHMIEVGTGTREILYGKQLHKAVYIATVESQLSNIIDRNPTVATSKQADGATAANSLCLYQLRALDYKILFTGNLAWVSL